MARSLKPQKVDEVKLPNTELRADIMLDRDKLTFFAQIGKEKLDDTDADDAHACKQLALAQLKAQAEYMWTAIILVDYESTEKRNPNFYSNRNPTLGARVVFDFRRCEVADKPGAKRRVERPMALDLSEQDQKRRAAGINESGYRDMWGSHNIELPYSDEVWDGLTKLSAIFRNADEQLGALLTLEPKALTLALARVPNNLLGPAPKKR